ncbi:MAG: glycosyl hydrolase family 18 protein, partial [Candidatus Limnocylindria bacterium]
MSFRFAPAAARAFAVLTAALLTVTSVAPAVASDPTAGPASGSEAAPAEEVEALERPTVHGEMLAAHEGDVIDLPAGPTPTVALAGPSATGAGSEGAVFVADGSVAGLPNGLRREVFGYLPYWSLNSTALASLDYSLVSTIAYFGVAAYSDGTLARTAQGTPTAGWTGWTSSHMTNVTNSAHARGVKVVLTVTMMVWNGDYSGMTAFLGSPSARANLISEIAGTLQDRNADGINLDFEPVPTSLRSQYTSFVREVKSGLTAAGVGSFLTVATMAGAATWSTGYDVVGLSASGAADALMVMSYDYSWSGSARAGGVAPIDSPYIFDVRQALTDHLAIVPPGKLIWGVPYYGRGWTTQSELQNAYACKTVELCPAAAAAAIGMSWAPTYATALGLAGQHGRLWDATGQVPWYRYFDGGLNTWKQVYYDDGASLGAKYALVEGNGLRGIGIWALLMDAGRPELWNQIDTYFQGAWFEDILGSQFLEDILWLANAGITTGCGNELFCPNAFVTRGQMAAFLVRALNPPSTATDYFTDDEASPFEADINRLAASGITGGCAA